MPSRRTLLLQVLGIGLIGAGAWPALTAAGPRAPDFTGIDGWLNTPAPLTLTALRGQVVLVDFWTYSCINCRRTVPILNRWQEIYGPDGLRIVGIHTPEFGFEQARTNVAEAVRRLGIRFPVGQDNAARTWRAWGNEAWPAFYLLDRDGRIVLTRYGEGHARDLEAGIRALLGLAPADAVARDDPGLSRVATPEIYFGALRATPQDGSQGPSRGEATYTFPTTGPGADQYQLDGTWDRRGEGLELRSPRGGLRLRFQAAKLHLVAAAPQPVTLRVRVDGGPARAIEVGSPTLYTLVDGETYGEHLLAFETEGPGLTLFSATFG